MLADGLLVECGRGASTGGRRSMHLSPGGVDVAVLAGADIDTDGASVAITTLDGSVVGAERVITSAADPKRTLALVVRMLKRCLPQERGPLVALGVSVPGDIDPATGVIASAPTLPRWVGLSIGAEFAGRVGVRTYVDNDVNVLALAEATLPAAERVLDDTFLVVEITSGVGCGIVIDGVVFRGSSGVAGDIGHIAVDPSDGTLCACGNRGCLEAIASAPAIIQAASALGHDGESVTLETISHSAQAGSPEVCSLLRTVGGHLGFVLAGLVSFFNPAAVILRSGIPGGEELLLNAVRQRIYERSLPASTRRLQVLPSRLGEGAGALGAAILAGQGFLGMAGSVPESRPTRQ